MSGKLTLQALRDVPPGGLVQFLWDFHRDQMQQENFRSHDDCRRFNQSFPRGIQLFEAVDTFHGEIQNGGIRQYICNTTGMPDPNPHAFRQVNEAIEALRVIGATESGDLLSQVIDLFTRHGWPPDLERQWIELSPDDEAFLDRIENTLFETEAAERDYDLLEKYLRKHLDDCVVV